MAGLQKALYVAGATLRGAYQMKSLSKLLILELVTYSINRLFQGINSVVTV